MSGLGAALLGRAAETTGIEAFAHPERIPWLLLLAAGLAGLGALRREPALDWPGLPELEQAGARRGDPARWLARGLRGVGVAALALVLAGPLAIHRAPPEPGLGLDLVLVVDASASMRALDTLSASGSATRLDLAREVVARFADRRVAEGDRIAVVVFGEETFTLCPLTGDAALVEAALSRIRVGMAGDATALGDALALAVKRVMGGDAQGGRRVVLLSDGRSNAGRIPLALAAELARGEGVRVHAVAIGSDEARVAVGRAPGTAGRGLRFERHEVDPAALEDVARRSGGRFHHARRSGDLARIYAEIDALERSPRRLPAREARHPRPEPLLALGVLALSLELLWFRLLFRGLP